MLSYDAEFQEKRTFSQKKNVCFLRLKQDGRSCSVFGQFSLITTTAIMADKGYRHKPGQGNFLHFLCYRIRIKKQFEGVI